MKILCLYQNACAEELFFWLREQGQETVLWKEKLDAAWCRKQQFDLAVSYTYRYILSDEQIRALGENVVNLHTSFLPWNRGADPNLWSFLEQTPRGVTLHYINAALDQGNIIAQELVEREAGETLKSSYEALDQAAKRLFQKAFLYYNHWESLRKLPLGKGSYHSLRDGERIKKGMATYDIPVETFLKETQNLLKSVNSPGGGGYSVPSHRNGEIAAAGNSGDGCRSSGWMENTSGSIPLFCERTPDSETRTSEMVLGNLSSRRRPNRLVGL